MFYAVKIYDSKLPNTRSPMCVLVGSYYDNKTKSYVEKKIGFVDLSFVRVVKDDIKIFDFRQKSKKLKEAIDELEDTTSKSL